MRREDSRVALGPSASAEEALLVDALRRGDESAFAELVARHHASMVRVSLLYVSSRAVAEEVVQDTWLSVLRSIDRFEGRSSLRTWIFTILGNAARKRAVREGRSTPFSSLGDAADFENPDADRFFSSTHPRWAGAWSTVVDTWDAIPEEQLLGREALAIVDAAIESLPPNQQTVMRLRDVEGWTAQDVCNVLGITDSNQRVLLHRARVQVRKSVESYFAGGNG
jgi:RNA polymerase sigma-70 factor (ECF subfamily)